MTLSARERDRIRWRCRRGMLELDLVLSAFLDRHLDALDDAQLDALNSMLMRPDPELLDLVMGRSEGRNAAEQALLALMRNAPIQRAPGIDARRTVSRNVSLPDAGA